MPYILFFFTGLLRLPSISLRLFFGFSPFDPKFKATVVFFFFCFCFCFWVSGWDLVVRNEDNGRREGGREGGRSCFVMVSSPSD